MFDPSIINFMFSDADLISEYDLVSPMSIIRYIRISLFARIAGKSPLCFVDLLKTMWLDDFGWVSALRSDLKWLSYSGNLASPPEDIVSVYDSTAVDYRSFIRSVRRYSLSKFADFDVPSSVPAVAPPIFFNSFCSECGKSFSSYQRLALHRKIKHGIRDPVDCLIATVHCTVCMKFFHNRVRVLNHIKYRSSVCRLNLTLAGPIINVEQAEILDEECRALKRKLYAAGLRAHSATEPCFRLCGPIPLPLIVDGSKHSSKCHILGFGRNHY